jgi:hypothetical protein
MDHILLERVLFMPDQQQNPAARRWKPLPYIPQDLYIELREALDRACFHDADDQSVCEHSALIRILKKELRWRGTEYRLEGFQKALFRRAAPEFADHLSRCKPEKAERTVLEAGIAAYIWLLTESNGVHAANRWLEIDGRRYSYRNQEPPASAIPAVIVEVASYLGVAGVGGIVGNRADAAFVATAKRLFQSVHERWMRRAPESGAALSEDEAVDAAKAAAIALEYEPSKLSVVSAKQTGQSWLIELQAQYKVSQDHELLRAHVPGGDPASTKILIYR